MNKKTLIIAAVILLSLIILGIVIFLIIGKKEKTAVEPVFKTETEEIEEAPKETKTLIWTDPAGFKFSYPKEIKIDPHQEDSQNYAHLELTSVGKDGKILIYLKETKYSNLADWVKREASGSSVLDTQIGGKAAKKAAYLAPEKLIAAAIDVDALLTIEMTPDKGGYWQQVYNGIVSSFEFTPLAGDKSGSTSNSSGSQPVGNNSSGVIQEAEEVIE